MCEVNEINGVVFLKPLLLLLAAFGLAPYYNFGNDKIDYNVQHKIYCLGISLLIVASSLYCAVLKYVSTKDPDKSITEVVLDVTLYVLLVTYNISAIYISSFKYRNLWQMLLDGLKRFDMLANYSSKITRTFVWKLMAYHIVIIVVLALDTHICMAR